MPTINGRYVPEHHAAAVAAAASGELIEDTAPAEPDPEPAKPAKKTASRTRRGRKAETAMLDDDGEKR